MTPPNTPYPPEDEPPPMSANPPDAAPTTVAPAGHPPRQRLRLVAAGGVTLAVVALFALAIALIGRNAGQTSVVVRLTTAQGTAIPQLTGIPAGWHEYHEPDGYFTVAIPDGWTATRTTGTATYGNATGSDSVTMTTVQLGGHPQGKKTITVGIDVTPIDDFLKRMACQNTNAPTPFVNATVAGLPATSLGDSTLLFSTSAASFQIDYYYPGYTGDILLTNPPTPIPQAELTQGQQQMATILSTFRPTPDTPFTCA